MSRQSLSPNEETCMKALKMSETIICLVCCAGMVWANESTTSNHAGHAYAARRIQDTEKLILAAKQASAPWDTQHYKDVDAITNIVHMLAFDSRTSGAAKQSLRDLFAALANPDVAIATEDAELLKRQMRTLEYLWVIPGIYNDETCLLASASTMGAVRERIIPDFKYEWLYRRGGLFDKNMDESEQEKFRRNREQRIEKERFQAELNRANQTLTILVKWMTLTAFQVTPSDEGKQDLLTKISISARMTEDEIAVLREQLEKGAIR